MTDLADLWVIPGLTLLAEWSVRWGLALAALAAWFVARPPRRASTRHGLCAAALAAGLLVPIAPRWGGATVPWPRPTSAVVNTIFPVPDTYMTPDDVVVGRPAPAPDLSVRTTAPVAFGGTPTGRPTPAASPGHLAAGGFGRRGYLGGRHARDAGPPRGRPGRAGAVSARGPTARRPTARRVP